MRLVAITGLALTLTQGACTQVNYLGCYPEAGRRVDAGGDQLSGGGPDGRAAEAGTVDATTLCPPTPPSCSATDYDTTSTCVTGIVLDVNGLVAVDGVRQAMTAEAYPPLPWFTNPTTTAPIGMTCVDACGYFKITHVPVDFTAEVAIVIQSASRGWVTTAVAFDAKNDTATPPVTAYTVSAADDIAWSTAAGLASGTTFASLGTTLVWYYDKTTSPGLPVGGVTPVLGCAASPPGQDFFFTSVYPSLTSLQPGTFEGNVTSKVSGWAAITGDSTVQALTGQGGACSTGSCTSWDSALAAAPPGVYFVTTRGGR